MLLAQMLLTAMVRNLAKMTAVGLLTPDAEAIRQVRARLEREEAFYRAFTQVASTGQRG
ncbi:TROVE domain-containing protein [Thiorhodovibrio frisius]|uniref:TROVE domain-containing protein n=1 Tax=Thiorhodovibrio frisius TaxID=631362 RepID=UPI00022C6B84|nr:TROVE domain-containing protein [Thiorhodovibrio frisius]WPL22038.1 hypothetical protein Thiofri_02189 [Thiorhodovibrio frisius]